MDVTYDFGSAVIKTEPIDDYPNYQSLSELGLLNDRPEVIFHAEIKTEPANDEEMVAQEVLVPYVPDEPTHLIDIDFMNPLTPTDLSMPKEMFKNRPLRTPSGKLDMDNGTRLKCKLCSKMCRSKHEFYVHVRTHDPRCVHCGIKFKSWKQFEKHIPSCTRKNGIIRIPQRPGKAKKERRPFKCQLCDRKYVTYANLFNHQVQRCKKRYVSDTWIVKI